MTQPQSAVRLPVRTRQRADSRSPAAGGERTDRPSDRFAGGERAIC
ncbi:hypothetical protein [Haloarcula onubensis]|uniref:Uncharacterized protein n=1 Tax=Haloarcula onubensis TaxID=2950539 RepID=A0ABU2FKE6_9EURY|nr:hypothetical protein [Halomicroarcula sp. S3CR25-11]MDS0280732.1 hypothetical protein [Halomicroarcula sp. S3CR25-11]